MLKDLDNDVILDAYYKAIKLNLDIDFISILKNEIDERSISVSKPKINYQGFPLIIN